jgi:hypothetical protein
MLASAHDRGEGRFMGMFLASAPERCGRWLGRRFASPLGRSGGRKSQLLQADIERSSHLALALPLARSLPRSRTQTLARGTAGFRRVRLIRFFLLEGLAKPLQFKDQRCALRPDSVILGIPEPA